MSEWCYDYRNESQEAERKDKTLVLTVLADPFLPLLDTESICLRVYYLKHFFPGLKPWAWSLDISSGSRWENFKVFRTQTGPNFAEASLGKLPILNRNK
jgi:hypothetical protein